MFSIPKRTDGHNEAEFGMSWCAGFGGSFYNSYFEVSLFNFQHINEKHEQTSKLHLNFTIGHAKTAWI